MSLLTAYTLKCGMEFKGKDDIRFWQEASVFGKGFIYQDLIITETPAWQELKSACYLPLCWSRTKMAATGSTSHLHTTLQRHFTLRSYLRFHVDKKPHVKMLLMKHSLGWEVLTNAWWFMSADSAQSAILCCSQTHNFFLLLFIKIWLTFHIWGAEIPQNGRKQIIKPLSEGGGKRGHLTGRHDRNDITGR